MVFFWDFLRFVYGLFLGFSMIFYFLPFFFGPFREYFYFLGGFLSKSKGKMSLPKAPQNLKNLVLTI